MMAGGLIVFGFGLDAMLLVIGLPVGLIFVLVWVLTHRENAPTLIPVPVYQNTSSPHSCQRCGTNLQAGWSHCPQCGAVVSVIRNPIGD